MDGLQILDFRKWSILLALGVVLSLLIVPLALAFDGEEGDRVVIEADEVIEGDYYVGAQAFVLDGTIEGDLIVGASSVEINGTVGGDLWAVGQSILINGQVEDDVRVAGYALGVEGQVGDDLIGAGFSLDEPSGSSIRGDLLFAGYQMLVGGEVGGDAHLAGGAVEIAGSVGEDLTVDVSGVEPNQQIPPGFPFFTPPGVPSLPTVQPGLTFGEEASVGGDLSYTANAQVDIPSGTVAGEVDFTEYVPEQEKQEAPERPEPPSLAMRVARWFLRQIRRFITLLLIGVVMMWLAPRWTRKMSGIVQEKPLPSFGWGFVVIALFLVVMFALVMATIFLAILFGAVTLGELAGRFLVLGGLATGALGFSFSILWSYVTKIIISLLVGQLIFRLFNSQAEANRWWPMVLGVVVFVLIVAVPFLGLFVQALAILLGLGALWIWGRDRLAARRSDEDEPEPEPRLATPEP